ncbi:flagellar biosynthetic protein FliR [Escherichia coli]
MKRRTQLTLGLALLALAPLALAQGGDIALLNVVTHGNTQEYSVKIQVLILMTLVGLLPTMVLMMTCFTRFIIVLSLLRQALGLWFPFVRIMAFLRYMPVLDNSALTARVRIILSLALAIIITPLIPHPVPHDLLSLNSLILTVEQILWGMLFGLMFQFLFLALQLAGQILSFNMGMSMAVMNDPSSGASTTVLAELINVYAILLFFAMDGHLLLVSVLYKGFTYWPIGNALHPQTLRTIALAFSWVLASASLLALPTTFIMLIVQGCFGLLNRIAPPLNLFSLGFPINMLAGLVCFATLLYNLPDHYLHLANFVLQQLDALKGHYGG